MLVPGHAFLAASLAEDGSERIFIESTMLGRAPFGEAVVAGEKLTAEHAEDSAEDSREVNVDAIRARGLRSIGEAGP
jgi:hypothetical protein